MSSKENKKIELVNQLTEIDKRQLKDATKAYSNEEYETIIKVIPDDYLWDELLRRNSNMNKEIDFVADVLGVTLDNVIPISAKAWQEIRSKYDDLKEKFQKIRKGTGTVTE